MSHILSFARFSFLLLAEASDGLVGSFLSTYMGEAQSLMLLYTRELLLVLLVNCISGKIFPQMVTVKSHQRREWHSTEDEKIDLCNAHSFQGTPILCKPLSSFKVLNVHAKKLLTLWNNF